MLVYRARLDGAACEVLSVAVRQRPVLPFLGAGSPGAPYMVTVRYAAADGTVRTHRGLVRAAGAPGATLAVAACQVDGAEALITLRPAGAPRAPRGVAVADRFRLPLSLQAWGVTAIAGAEVAVRATCRARGDALLLRGVALVQVATPGATFRFRIPFCRVLAADAAEAGLCWQSMAGAAGLHLQVAPGGLITGELVVAARCEGRPRAAPPAPADCRTVWEVGGRIARVAAEHAGQGHAVLRGMIELDVFWLDGAGTSRWTGRSLPFSALLEVPGVAEGDRLEGWARLERLAQQGAAGATVAALAVAAGVTALRPAEVALGEAQFRLDRVAGSAVTTLTLTAQLWEAPGGAGPGGEVEARTVALPLAGPAAGWEEVSVALVPEAGAGAGGHGRWRIRAALRGRPVGEVPYPSALKAVTGGAVPVGPEGALAVVPALTAVDAGGIRLEVILARGPQLPLARGEGGEAEAGGVVIPVPGPVRAILAVAATGRPGARGQVSVLVHVGRLGLRLVTAEFVADSGPVSSLTAFPIKQGEAWFVRVSLMAKRTSSS
jgi:hypothetical protein